MPKEISHFADDPFFKNKIKGLEYDELFRLGSLACEFPRKAVKEILEGKKGNIEEAANEIITAMYDEYWDTDAAHQKLSSVFEKIISERRTGI